MSPDIKQRIDKDIKQAMLAGDKTLVTTLRGLKSAILYVEVAKGVRGEGLADSEVIEVLSKESKKRQESADMYAQGGSPERARGEIDEKRVIEKYLPPQLSEDELRGVISEVIREVRATDMSAMGQVISKVKQCTIGTADGAAIARIVKEMINP